MSFSYRRLVGSRRLKHVIWYMTLIYFLLFLFSNWFFYVFSSILTTNFVKMYIGIRDSFVLFFILLLVPRRFSLKRFPALLFNALALLGLVGIYFIMCTHKNFATLFYTRFFIFPWLYLLFGFLSYPYFKDFFYKWFNFLFFLLVFYSIGSILIFVFREKLLNSVLLELYGSLAMRSYNQQFGVLGNAVSYEFIRFVGRPVVRLSGFLFDPPITGVFLSLISVYIFVKDKKLPLKLFPIVAGILTLTKGFIFIFFITVFWIFIVVYMKKKLPSQLVININNSFLLFLLIILFIFSIVAGHSSPYKFSRSVYSHTKGFITTFNVIIKHPLGTGLGTQGNLAYSTSSRKITETYWGVFVGQTGVFGLLVLIGILIFSYKNLILSIGLKDDILWIYSLYFFVFLLSAMFSESTMAIRVSSILFFTYGLVYARIIKLVQRNYM